MKVINLENVNYKILKDFNLDFKDKDKILDLVVLAGINGSGKTTILEFLHNKLKYRNYKLNGDIFIKYGDKIIEYINLDDLINKYIDFDINDMKKIHIEIGNQIIYLKAEQNSINSLKNSIKKYLKYLFLKKRFLQKRHIESLISFYKRYFLEWSLVSLLIDWIEMKISILKIVLEIV